VNAVVTSGPQDVRDSIGEVETSFPFASVTKLFAAYATLVAVDRGLVGLDDKAGPATVRHLLAHASGLPMEKDGDAGEPEAKRIYSNYGFDVLGEAVAEATGSSIQEWIEETVLMPLELSSILIEGSPAHSGEGNARDLAAFGRELLNPTLIDRALFDEATSPVFPDLAGILPGYGRQNPNLWGLGFEIRGKKSPHWLDDSFSPQSFGHFGQSGSFLVVDPEASLTIAYLGSEPFGKKLKDEWPGLTGRLRSEFA